MSLLLFYKLSALPSQLELIHVTPDISLLSLFDADIETHLGEVVCGFGHLNARLGFLCVQFILHGEAACAREKHLIDLLLLCTLML